MNILLKKIFMIGALMLILMGTQLFFALDRSRSSEDTVYKQEVLPINASDTVSTESKDDDDDEWEA
jgi:hypothetical protein